MDDLKYLETYEPVLRFAQSERFFPMDAERYLEHCQIFPSGPQGVIEYVKHLGQTMPARLGKLHSEQFYLRFVNNPLSDSDAWVWWAALSAIGTAGSWFIARWTGMEIALTASMLAALVIFMLASPIRLRIIPAVFAALFFSALGVLPVWFFLRPSPYVNMQVEYLVLLPTYLFLLSFITIRTMKFILDRIIPEGPGLIMDMLSQATEQVAGQAYQVYAQILEKDPQPVYYGRVLRKKDSHSNRWTILQYHFFYAFNDWRLASNGMNHHEGDWEMVAIYLKNEKPFGMLFSQHAGAQFEPWENVRKVVDNQGRRTTHPLVYVALGSHANYTRPEVIRSAKLYKTGWVQRFLYWTDGLIHFIFLLFNPKQEARQIALRELSERTSGLLNEDALVTLRDEADHYVVSLPLEMASGDGFRIGFQGNHLREGVMKSSSYLKRSKSDRPVIHPSVQEWRQVILNPEPGWVQYKGRWGVRSVLENESGPPGPKWDRSTKDHAPEIRARWGRPLEWVDETPEE